HVQFISGNLRERGFDPLPDLGFAGEYRDLAIGADLQPGIQARVVGETAGKFCRLSLRKRTIAASKRSRCEADRQAPGDEFAARERGCHVRALPTRLPAEPP